MKLAMYKGTRPGVAGIYNRLVRWVDGGIYSHAELLFSDGRCASASFMDKGVRFKTFVMDPEKWDIFELDDSYDEGYALGLFNQENGSGYDSGGNIKFVIKWWPQSSTKWFCTEIIAEALKHLPGYWFGPKKLLEVVRLKGRA